MKQKMCVWAGIFVVAMFLLTTVPTIAMVPNQQMAQQYGVYYEDEAYSFPPELPPGTSSLTCITKRRAIDPWNGCIFDVGFSVWTMRLRDGPAHWLYFPETIEVVWDKGEEPQIIQNPISDAWQESNAFGFDIVVEQYYKFPRAFYTATVYGCVYKDMGEYEYKYKELRGYNYYLENNLLGVITIEQSQNLMMD